MGKGLLGRRSSDDRAGAAMEKSEPILRIIESSKANWRNDGLLMDWFFVGDESMVIDRRENGERNLLRERDRNGMKMSGG